MAAWDWYIGTGHHDYLTSGAIHDLTRGFKRRNFWVMETQPGNVNWAAINNVLNRGEARAMAWHAVAHGADGRSLLAVALGAGRAGTISMAHWSISPGSRGPSTLKPGRSGPSSQRSPRSLPAQRRPRRAWPC